MSGVIESANSRSVSGWVTGAGSGANSLYFLTSSGELIEECRFEPITRPDLGGKGWGFSLATPSCLSLDDLAAGNVRLCPDRSGVGSLKIWRPLHAAILADALSAPELGQYVSLISSRTKEGIVPLLSPLSSRSSEDGLPASAGTTSADEAAIIGQDGALFLFRGSNDVVSLYQKQESARISAAWLKLVRDRSKSLSLEGSRFFQLFIPEKTSVSAELVPYPCSVGSSQYLSIIEHLACEDDVIDGLPVLRQSLARDASYRKLDSHLSPIGCEVLVQHLLVRMGYGGCVRTTQTKEQLLMADLASRFEGLYPKGLERLILASKLEVAGISCEEPILVASADVGSGHVGTQRQWSAPTAPIGARVLCFGNSFFERGNHSTSLSWWFSRIFRDFRFVWSADLDLDVVREYAPDIVVCQTVERFMARLPSR